MCQWKFGSKIKQTRETERNTDVFSRYDRSEIKTVVIFRER